VGNSETGYVPVSMQTKLDDHLAWLWWRSAWSLVQEMVPVSLNGIDELRIVRREHGVRGDGISSHCPANWIVSQVSRCVSRGKDKFCLIGLGIMVWLRRMPQLGLASAHRSPQ
jgi:hypothetical protein